MKLYSSPFSGITLIQNAFIDRYMVHANGEFVKVYLYLLRCADSRTDFSLSSIADVLDCTEKDISRALAYWEKLHLIQVERNAQGEPVSLTFPDTFPALTEAESTSPKIPASVPKASLSQGSPEAVSGVSAADREPMNRSRMQELAGQEDIRQLVFVAEQYLQHPLASTELEDLLYYYDSLRFSVDLIDYLLQYCISKGSTSFHYIRKVALAWAEKGISTVAQAREETNLYNRNYFAIMNAFGIKRRNPNPSEIEFMSRWLNEFGFTLDIIQEACNRTILQAHEPSFQYAGRILEQWKKQGVHTKADIVELDKKHALTQNAKKQQAAAKQIPASPNRFNNFQQREYDYNQLDKKLFGG